MRRYAVITLMAGFVGITAIFYFFHLRVYAPGEIAGVVTFGRIRVGGEAVAGRGSFTFAPYYKIPPAKFYVTVVKKGLWCSNEDCSLDGALIETMGGWLQVEKTGGGSEIREEIGLDLPENKNVETIVIIGDGNNKIAGIYPNRGLGDVLPILRLHPDLADFSRLAGVQEFGVLKVGQEAPLQPGDSLARFGGMPARYNITHISAGKKFYLFSVQKRKYDVTGGYAPYDNGPPQENKYICFISGCRYPEPDAPHDFLFAYIEDLGGWFFSNDMDNAEMPPLFSLSQEAVLNGTSSLVVLIDADGIIRALHPSKTLADALTILSQHPDLADLRVLYPPSKE
ncbi:MAG: hypothetical protein WAP52_01895 [Candidatus Sungiibacteriota bacterium]